MSRREDALAALVADVGREALWQALSAAFLRTGQAAETPSELLVEARALCPALAAHPLGAVVAAERALIAWAKRSPAGGGA